MEVGGKNDWQTENLSLPREKSKNGESQKIISNKCWMWNLNVKQTEELSSEVQEARDGGWWNNVECTQVKWKDTQKEGSEERRQDERFWCS